MKKILYLVLLFLTLNVGAKDLSVVSFNIKWIGYSDDRKNHDLAKMLSQHDIVFIQEMVSPPVNGFYPSGKPYKKDKESSDFLNAMLNEGFSYALSIEDSGTGDNNETNSASTEWSIAFYKADNVLLKEHYYIEEDRTNHDNYERVPYLFYFENKYSGNDYKFINVHLKPSNGLKDRERRRQELNSIFTWINLNNYNEKDFIILGDMNIYDCDRLNNWIPKNYYRPDKECSGTNLDMSKPYDQVIVYEKINIEDVHVINLYDYFKKIDTKTFKSYYSDHHPIQFYLK
tara:strand:+ start:40574 stop:41434 length:861 start_codon:yes stop_codon:yes gene_type:complete